MHSSPSSEGSWKGSSFSVDRLVGFFLVKKFYFCTLHYVRISLIHNYIMNFFIINSVILIN